MVKALKASSTDRALNAKKRVKVKGFLNLLDDPVSVFLMDFLSEILEIASLVYFVL